MGAANTKRVRKPRKGARNEDGGEAGEVRRAKPAGETVAGISGLTTEQASAARDYIADYVEDQRISRELEDARAAASAFRVKPGPNATQEFKDSYDKRIKEERSALGRAKRQFDKFRGKNNEITNAKYAKAVRILGEGLVLRLGELGRQEANKQLGARKIKSTSVF